MNEKLEFSIQSELNINLKDKKTNKIILSQDTYLNAADKDKLVDSYIQLLKDIEPYVDYNVKIFNEDVSLIDNTIYLYFDISVNLDSNEVYETYEAFKSITNKLGKIIKDIQLKLLWQGTEYITKLWNEKFKDQCRCDIKTNLKDICILTEPNDTFELSYLENLDSYIKDHIDKHLSTNVLDQLF